MKNRWFYIGFWFVLIYYPLMTYGQFSRAISKEEARDQLYRMKINMLSSMEAYLYYSRGINPSQSAAFLDDRIAQAEHNLLISEEFADAQPAFYSDIEKISGFWYSIRNKIIHFYRRGQSIKLYERFSEMNRKINRLNQKLLSGTHVKITPRERFLRDALERTHMLSFVFMAKLMEKSDYFNLIFDAQMRNYTALIDSIDKMEFKTGKNKAEIEYLSKLMNGFADYLLTENPDPEKVYAKTLEIHNNITGMLNRL